MWFSVRFAVVLAVLLGALLAGCQGERTVILPPSELNGGACVGMSPQDSQTVVWVVSGVSGEPMNDVQLSYSSFHACTTGNGSAAVPSRAIIEGITATSGDMIGSWRPSASGNKIVVPASVTISIR